MNIMALLIIACGGAFAVIWLIQYIPLHSNLLKVDWSPRLVLCKLLAPFDAAITIILICGAWIGLTSATFGIGMMIYNVMTGLGISGGVLITRKYFVPRWRKTYERKLIANESLI